jgi:hypothetical protein
MSDPNRFDGGTPGEGRTTSTMEPAETPTIPPAPPRTRETSRGEATRVDVAKRRSPLDDITLERPRTHPVAYAALALAGLALVLSLFGLGGGGGGGYRQVKVGTNDCVIGRQGDTDVLYCRAPAVP